MNTALDPSLFLIAEDEWQNELKRDEFLRHLDSNLQIINTYQLTLIYWTDGLEACLWCSPRLPPWRQNADWRNSMVPVLYRSFVRNTQRIELSQDWQGCTVSHQMQACHQEAFGEFLKLMHEMIHREESVFLCLGRMNQGLTETTVLFSCPCHADGIIASTINEPEDWFKYVDLEGAFWPETITDQDRLCAALEAVRRGELGGAPFLYTYRFANAFLKDLVAAVTHRGEIFRNMALRLTLTKNQAAQEARLQDEKVRGKREYRFRVTPRPASTRIHYRFVGAIRNISCFSL